MTCLKQVLHRNLSAYINILAALIFAFMPVIPISAYEDISVYIRGGTYLLIMRQLEAIIYVKLVRKAA